MDYVAENVDCVMKSFSGIILTNRRILMKHLRDKFEYDHEEGCLRWKALDDNYLYFSADGTMKPAISKMSRVKPGSIAGKRGFGDYRIKQSGASHPKSCALRMIWQHVTGEIMMGKIRTMDPRDTKFCIENLYVVPFEQRSVHRDRAKNSTVVSYCFERKRYTIVSVDGHYNKTVLSYHDSIDDALKALNEPEVSFL